MNKKQTKKEIAIEVLNTFKSELENIDSDTKGNIWKAKVLESLNLYIGDGDLKKSFKESDFLIAVKKYRGDTGFLSNGGYTTSYEYDNSKKNDFKNLLDNIIHHIQTHGVINEEKAKTNFLSDLSNIGLITIICAWTAGAIAVGFYFETLRGDRELNELNNKFLQQTANIKLQQDTITTLNFKLKKP